MSEYDEGIKFGSTDGNVLGTILGNLDRIKLGIDVGTELGSLDEFFYISNYGKLEQLFLGDSLESTDVKVLGSDEGINLILSDGKVIGTILVDVDGITLGIDVGTDMGPLD